VKEKIKKAIAAHGAWKDRLNTAIATGKLEMPIPNVKADNLCEFGKWLYGDAAALTSSDRYGKVKELHAHFHRAAGAVAELAVAGRKAEAEAALAGEYTAVSTKLTGEMTDWDASL